jgi:glyoxylase-like metal-dependent hydrolase (beta-lactamase superfamily II)/ferredoxin
VCQGVNRAVPRGWRRLPPARVANRNERLMRWPALEPAAACATFHSVASKAKRLATNADGDFYVDSTCIDCGTCRWMAPASFDAKGNYARVYQQPRGREEQLAALKALVACPTASIGTIEKHDLGPIAGAFPDPIDADVFHCGYHHEGSFGATSYLIVRERGNVLVDSPRFTRRLVKRIEDMGGIETMFLTHADDVADHQKFRDHFGCRRVLHADDVRHNTRTIERPVEGIEPVALADDLIVIPTPGHTEGSACLLYRETFLFSGDHVAWSIPMQRVYAFSGACWYDWDVQIESMERLAEYRFEHILPGHSAPCRFPADDMRARMRDCVEWMRAA